MRSIAIVFILAVSTTTRVSAWGFAAHRIVAENAAAKMPPGLSAFYQANADALSDASIEPDSVLRGREGDTEARRHYLDLDELDSPPFARIPADEAAARRLYGERKLGRAGLLPWRVAQVYGQLREAFREKDWSKAVAHSGWLAHYIADAYQPLHTTKNYDGQGSCNQGVHSAFETDLIDRRKALYRTQTTPEPSLNPGVVGDPARFILAEMISSYDLVDDILDADTQAVRAVKKQRKDYYEEMERQVGPLARRQMSKAEATVIAFCHAAWLEAGQPAPPLTPLKQRSPTKAARP
jgi:hypothetical protein